jgi:hypothetical protein
VSWTLSRQRARGGHETPRGPVAVLGHTKPDPVSDRLVLGARPYRKTPITSNHAAVIM